MDFRLLGSLEVQEGDRLLTLGGPKQRTVLALLLLQANRVVTVDRLTDALWGSEPPETARNTLQTYVRHLRRALGADRIEHRSSGYVLVADPAEVDLLRFQSLVEEARRIAAEDPTRAITALREAIGLWRGPAFDDLAEQEALRPEIARLEESRMVAIEDRIDAGLAVGGHRELVPELETLVGRHPFRERLRGQLMVALYRSSRQGDALEAYRRGREILAEDLGIDPSPDLQRLEEQILHQDPELQLAGEPLRGYRLVERVGEGAFGVVYRARQPQVGREVAIKSIRSELANDPEFIRRFEREARLVARLEHPRVVPLYDYWRDPDGAYLVMRFLRGGSLRARVDRSGPLAADEAVRMLDQVAQALTAAHRQGIVHRDVKPENVLLDDDGNAYLSDFGIAAELFDVLASRSRAPVSPAYLSPEQIRGEPVSPSTDVYALGVVLFEALTGRPPFPDGTPQSIVRGHLHDPLPAITRDRPDLPATLDGIIARATAKDPAARFADALAFSASLRQAIGTSTLAGPVPLAPANPYKGLHAFDEPDAPDFFGREHMTEQLVARLREDVDGARLLAVVGPSGSGKSSLVRAGLIPALRGGALPCSETWFVSDLVPGTHPFEELEAALLRVAIDPPASLAEQLERDNRGLVRAVKRILPADGTELVLVVDQLEELFTLTASESERGAFLAALAEAANDPESRLRVIVALRADFYDRPLLDARFGRLLAARTEAVTPLAPDELERAIGGPAERVGVSLEPALIAETVAEVAAQPGGLPLLQYALTELFDRRTDGRMSLPAYRGIGGVTGALAGRAEELFTSLESGGKEACRQLFLHLVSPGEGVEDTRRRVRRSELDAIEVERESMERVIEVFGRHRLLSFDRDDFTREPTVDLAHEALIRGWARLRGWIDEAREDIRMHRRLTASADDWLGAGREPSFLLSGSRLERVEAWASETRLALGRDEREFVEESVDRREAFVATEHERLERERRLEQRSGRRMRALVAVLAVASLVASGLTAVAVNRTRVAERRTAEAQITALTRTALSYLQTDPELSVLLALHAVADSLSLGDLVPAGTVEALHWALQADRVEYPVRDGATAIVEGPLGRKGIFTLSTAALVNLARENVDRAFTGEECARFFGSTTCPSLPARFPARIPSEPVRPVSGTIAASPPLAGTTVTILTNFDPRQNEDLLTTLQPLMEATGLTVRPVGNPGVSLPEFLSASVAAADRPDLIFFAQPGLTSELARRGELMDLGTYVDIDRLRVEQSPYLVSLGTLGREGSWPSDDGTTFAAMMNVNVKSLIWYPVPEFGAAGYEVPRTWAELMALSDRMVADGRTPWCQGFLSSGSDGWPGSDWIEELLLAGEGPSVYDRWTSHEIGFDSLPVRAAFDRLSRILFTDGYESGGARTAIDNDFVQAQYPMFDDPPRCWLYHAPSFQVSLLPGGTSAGTGARADTNFFPFPPITKRSRGGLLGGGDMLAAVTDRPEVRAVVSFLLSAEFGTEMTGSGRAFLSANRTVDLEQIPPRWRPMTELVDAALAADTFRFDASDLMPSSIGEGLFWRAMLQYVRQGPQSVDRILARLDAAWPSE